MTQLPVESVSGNKLGICNGSSGKIPHQKMLECIGWRPLKVPAALPVEEESRKEEKRPNLAIQKPEYYIGTETLRMLIINTYPPIDDEDNDRLQALRELYETNSSHRNGRTAALEAKLAILERELASLREREQ